MFHYLQWDLQGSMHMITAQDINITSCNITYCEGNDMKHIRVLYCAEELKW